jgi:hypothetical protein
MMIGVALDDATDDGMTTAGVLGVSTGVKGAEAPEGIIIPPLCPLDISPTIGDAADTVAGTIGDWATGVA